MNFILRLVVSAVAVFFVANLLPGVAVDDFLSALLVSVALAFLNGVVKPILTVLTIPVTVFTLGFFLLVINAVMILLATRLVSGFHVESFWWALIFSIILSVFTGVLNFVFGVNHSTKEEE